MCSFFFMGAASAASTSKDVNLTNQKFSTVTIPFTSNEGQILNKEVKYSANTLVGTVYVTNNGITYTLNNNKTAWIVSQSFQNANNVSVTGKNQSKTKVTYYIGKTVTKNVKTYDEVQYSNLYNGINLDLVAHGKNVEQIYTIGTNGNIDNISMLISGATELKIAKDGSLEIINGTNSFELTNPAAYQLINGKMVYVPVSYTINGLSYGYQVGAYNKKYALTIDPLLDSTYLGGSSYDGAQAIAVDNAGNVYVTGYTGSDDFPVTTSQQFNSNTDLLSTGSWDVFVSKFSPDLSTLESCTFLGGSQSDKATGIALDDNGAANCDVFITGITYSTNDTGYLFPTTNNSYAVPWALGGGDVFISKLNSTNLILENSTVYGGNREDLANAIMVDSSNNVYVTGETFSFNGTDPDGNSVTSYPGYVTGFNEPNAMNTYTGNGDVFVSKFNNDLTCMLSSVIFGGTGTSYATAIATDQQNYIYITGATNATDFPLITNTNLYPNNGYETNNGGYDAFVVKLDNMNLGNIDGFAFIGGSANDYGTGIAVDSVGRVYVTGGTYSDNIYTTKNAFQSKNNGEENAFLTIFDKQIQNVLYSTYIGGNGIDTANGIVLSNNGTIGLVGTTNSTNFPNINDNETTYGSTEGFEDVFLTTVQNPLTNATVQTTLLGGGNADYGNAIALNQMGDAYIAGITWSNDFPTTIGAYDTYSTDVGQYTSDAYVTALSNLVDTNPPQIVRSNPANGAVNVSTNTAISVVFDQPVTAGTAFDDISLSNANGYVAGTVAITGNTLTITPLSKYNPTTLYTLYLPYDSLMSLSNVSLTGSQISFTTLGPKVVSISPASGAVNVPVTSPITVTFNENVNEGPGFNNIKLTSSSGTVPITTTLNGNILTITPESGEFVGDTYTLTIPYNSLVDSANNVLNATFVSNFTCVKPQITSTNPVNGAVNVPVSSPITVTLNENVYQGLGFNNIILETSNGTIVSTNLLLTGNTLTITPTGGTLAGTTYTLIIPSNSLVDNGGFGLNSSYSTSFTCMKPQITAINPVNGGLVTANKVITVTLNEALNEGAGFSNIVLKTSSGTVIPITTTLSGTTLTIKKASGTFASGTYTLTIPSNSLMDSGNFTLGSNYVSSFTVDAVPPTVKSTSPANLQTSVSRTTPITIYFSENIQSGSNYSTIYVKNLNTGVIIGITTKISGNALVITTNLNRLANDTYQVYIPAASITDIAGNNLQATYTFKFKSA